MQRGSAWPTFSPHTTGSAGSSITCRSSCSYSACHTPSIGRPTSTPLTAATDYTYDQATGEFTLTPGRITVPAATYTQDAATGAWTTEPGISTLTVTGTL